jgi:hypothetical protein
MGIVHSKQWDKIDYEGAFLIEMFFCTLPLSKGNKDIG